MMTIDITTILDREFKIVPHSFKDEQTQTFLKAVKATVDASRTTVAPDDACFLNPDTVPQLSEYLVTL